MELKPALDSYISSISTTTGGANLLAKWDSFGNLAGYQFVSSQDGDLRFVSISPAGIDIVNENEHTLTLKADSPSPSAVVTFPMGYDGGPARVAYEEWCNNYFLSKTGNLQDLSGGVAQLNSYQLNTGAYIYNTGNLSLSNSHNGRVIISNNGGAATITIASGLAGGFSCQIIQNSSGSVTFTGAAGVSMNSYGGLTQIAGRYGSAAVQYTAANTYVLAGNLA
jgi:hypothetical protein